MSTCISSWIFAGEDERICFWVLLFTVFIIFIVFIFISGSLRWLLIIYNNFRGFSRVFVFEKGLIITTFGTLWFIWLLCLSNSLPKKGWASAFSWIWLSIDFLIGTKHIQLWWLDIVLFALTSLIWNAWLHRNNMLWYCLHIVLAWFWSILIRKPRHLGLWVLLTVLLHERFYHLFVFSFLGLFLIKLLLYVWKLLKYTLHLL